MSAAPTQTAQPEKRLEKKSEKKETIKKIDPHKFSKMLAAHCLDNGIELPPPAFMTDLDAMAAGTYEYMPEEVEEMDEEIESQQSQDEEEFSSAQDEYYLTASRPGKEVRRR